MFGIWRFSVDYAAATGFALSSRVDAKHTAKMSMIGVALHPLNYQAPCTVLSEKDAIHWGTWTGFNMSICWFQEFIGRLRFFEILSLIIF